jgi:hypothetical protein
MLRCSRDELCPWSQCDRPEEHHVFPACLAAGAELRRSRLGCDRGAGHDGPGRYTAVTAPITSAGRWRIAITIRTSEIDETTVLLSQTIR